MGAREREVQPVSPATPLAGDVLSLLQSQLFGGLSPQQQQQLREIDEQIARFEELARRGGPFENVANQALGSLRAQREAITRGAAGGGAFGLGVGPLQREAGTAIRQFIESGGGQFNLSPLFRQLEDIQNRRIAEQTADIRESFGVAGGRFGTPLAVGESRLRRELETEFGAQLGELSRQEFTNQQQRLLTAIAGLQQFGQQNIEPFFRFAEQGIFPTQFAFEQNPFITLLQTLGGTAGGAGEFIQGLSAGDIARFGTGGGGGGGGATAFA